MWSAVLLGSAACYVLKVAGLSMPQRVLRNPTVRRIAGLLPVALLAALIAVQTMTDDRALVLDARLAGVLAAAVTVRLRAPFLAVVATAAAVTALIRLAA